MTRKGVMTTGEEEVAFYFEVGNAITEWGNIEQLLLNVLVTCFENRGANDVTHRALSVGFMSIEGFRAKMDFAEATVMRYLVQHKPHEIENWKHLVKRVWSATGHRNKLAHWSVNQYLENNPGRRFMLIPPVFKKRRQKVSDMAKPPKKLPPYGAQALREIAKMRVDFICVALTLDNFAARMLGATELHARHHEQPVPPPPIATLRAQILEGLVRLLKSSEKKS